MIEIGSALDPGRKRIADQNQDALCVIRPNLRSLNFRPPLLIVADGMGGYQGGALASQTVVNSFSQIYLRAPLTVPPLKILHNGVSAALKAIKEQATQDPHLGKMGSTVVVAVIQGPTIFLLNVGDSRAYLINEHSIRQLSFDHSLVAEQLRQGIISEEDVRSHPRRNVLSMSISVGRDQVLPFSGTFRWKPGDCLLLCSDGLWGPVNEQQMQAVVMEYNPQQAAEKLVALANTNQGPGNIAVITARFR